MNVDPGRIEFEPLVREEGLWKRPSSALPLRVARAVYSGLVLRFPYGLLEGIRLVIDPAHYHQGNDADHKPTGEEETCTLPNCFLRGELSTPRGVIEYCHECRKREKLKKGDNQLRINAIDDEHDFLALTESSVRIKFKTTCSSCHQDKGAFSLKLWIADQQGRIIAQGQYHLGKVIANAAKRRRCQKVAAAQGEPPKKRRRAKAASRQPPPGPTASAPTSPASTAGWLQFRPIMPAPDLRAFQPLPGALWPPLGPPPPSVAQAQAHADPTQSPVPSCGGTSSPAPSPSPSPSHVDSCVDMSPISIELEGFSNGGLSNSPEAAETCANESPEDEYNDLGPDLIDLHPDIIAEMWRFERENALKC